MSRGSSRERLVVSITRDEAVRSAIYSNSLEELQQLSLLPGGFGKARRQAWPYLLGVLSSNEIDASISNIEESRDHMTSLSTQSPGSSASSHSEITPTCLHDSLSEGPSFLNFSNGTDLSPHPDEHQVQLDTDRSFVLYPVVQSSVNQKKKLQNYLHDVIMGVLRKRPALRYFQGYHDIVTVLFLTLPSELVLPSAEKLSLHRLRDSMGNGLEPLVGQLRILKRLLRMVDPPYAEILERSSPLPYYALSNLLTLFAHDVPTLPLIQHVFDWLLCREPIASIWLAAAVILSRKEDVLALEREGEEALGMIHAVLSAVPPLSEDNLSIQSLNSSMDAIHTHTEPGGSEDKSTLLSNVVGEETSATAVDLSELIGGEFSKVTDPLTDSWTINSPTSPPVEIFVPDSKAEFDSGETDDTTPDLSGGSDIDISDKSCSQARTQPHSHSHPTSLVGGGSDIDISDEACSQARTQPHSHSHSTSLGGGGSDIDISDEECFQARTQLHSHSHSTSLVVGGSDNDISDKACSQARTQPHSHSRSTSVSFPGEYKERLYAPPLPLATLLCHASDLLAEYPPSSPMLRLTETFGSHSALRTNGLTVPDLFTDIPDDVAESFVGGDRVVLPMSQEEEEEELFHTKRPRNRESDREKMRNGRSIRITNGLVVRRQTVFAGVVLLLGVAVALYGFTPRGKFGRNGGANIGSSNMKYAAAWVGGLLGVGERLGVGL